MKWPEVVYSHRCEIELSAVRRFMGKYAIFCCHETVKGNLPGLFPPLNCLFMTQYFLRRRANTYGVHVFCKVKVPLILKFTINQTINQTLCELNDSEDDETERWIEDALNSVTECFKCIEMYLLERADNPVPEGNVPVSK